MFCLDIPSQTVLAEKVCLPVHWCLEIFTWKSCHTCINVLHVYHSRSHCCSYFWYWWLTKMNSISHSYMTVHTKNQLLNGFQCVCVGGWGGHQFSIFVSYQNDSSFVLRFFLFSVLWFGWHSFVIWNTDLAHPHILLFCVHLMYQ